MDVHPAQVQYQEPPRQVTNGRDLAPTGEHPPAAPQSESAMMLAAIKEVALNPALDISRMQQLLDMHKGMVADQKRQEFAAAFVQMKPELPRVVKDRDNTQTKSRYATLDAINHEIDPILQKHGFGTSSKIVSQTPDSITVKAELWYRNGHVEENTITMPLDDKGPQGTVNKTGPHATASSVMYARRVAICALLNISTGDDRDGNTDTSAQTITDIQARTVTDLLLRCPAEIRERFAEKYGKSSAVPRAKFDMVVAHLRKNAEAANA